jgi:3-hydroxyisobutyrate dehydrogenase-like beta-hydroxyacid dehydrogenase
MGSGMATRLVNAGFPLTVWNRTALKAEPLAARGARVAGTPREVAAASEVVLTSLADPAAVTETYYGPDGVLAGTRRGAILVDLSTVAPALSKQLAVDSERAGARFLDAPVAGSIKAAEEGTLAVLVGGDRDAYDACQEIFKAIGRISYHLGPSGSGATMKLISNAMLATVVQALAEAVALGEKAGLDPAAIVEVIGASSAAAPVVKAKAAAIAERAYHPAAFTLKLMQKDLWLALSLANELTVPMPAAAVTHDMVVAANATGRSDHDFTAVTALMEQLAGVTR